MNDKKQDSGILLIGHGSRLPYNKEVIDKIAEKYSEIMPNYNIEVGYMELCEPSISQAFNKLKETGVNRIIVQPVFLAEGMHTKADIPTLLKFCAKGSEPDNVNIELSNKDNDFIKSESSAFTGELIYLEPIGPDDGIANLITQRIQENL